MRQLLELLECGLDLLLCKSEFPEHFISDFLNEEPFVLEFGVESVEGLDLDVGMFKLLD